MSKKEDLFPLWQRQLRKLDQTDPDKAACLLYARWFAVMPLSLSARDQPWLTQANRRFWSTTHGQLPGYGWGSASPKVLLLHGWGGRASQMAFLGQQLAEQGVASVAFDAPAHGDAPGHHSNVLRMSEALAAVLLQQPTVETVITHSYSLGAALLARREQGSRFRQMVAISPSVRPEARFAEFIQHIGLGTATLQAFEQMLAQHLDRHWWQRISPLNNVQRAAVQGLIIHDRRDRIVPIVEARELHQQWLPSDLVETEGLGHLRILSAPEVARTILDFL